MTLLISHVSHCPSICNTLTQLRVCLNKVQSACTSSKNAVERQYATQIAEKNGLMDKLPFSTLDEARSKYEFDGLQSFLDIYYAGCAVLVTQQVRCAWRTLYSATARLKATGASQLRPRHADDHANGVRSPIHAGLL